MTGDRMKGQPAKKSLLSVAGYDPSGGAGVLLDIRVFEKLGFNGYGVLTAVTAQNTAFVSLVHPLPAALVKKQFETLIAEIEPAGIKIGMTGAYENLLAVRSILGKCRLIPRVVDPILKSTSGAPLTGNKTKACLLTDLSGRAELITPNIEEAAALSGLKIDRPAGMKEAAKAIFDRSGIPCLVKGGHLAGRLTDVLFDGQKFHLFPHRRINKKVHGTGCYLSASILAHMAMGFGLPEACSESIDLTEKAIEKASSGSGRPSAFRFCL